MFVIYMFTFQSRMISNILIVVPRPLTLVLALSLRRARSRTPSSLRLHRLLPRSLPINVFDRLRLPTLLALQPGIIRYRRLDPFDLLRTSSLVPLSSSNPSSPLLRTRPLKILIYSADGYTESSSLALSLLMAYRKLSLPETYLELLCVSERGRVAQES